jgi:hypothetical protein
MTTLERIEQLEKDLKIAKDQIAALQLNADAKSAEAGHENGSIRQVAELANSRSLSLEISLAELAKTLTALAAVLAEKKLIESQEIMDRIIKMNQDEDEREINGLLKQKLLLKSDQVKPHSFVVASHTIVDLANPASSKLVMEKRLLRLPTPLVSNQLREDLVGRKVGDQVQINKSDDGKVHVLTIKEIYDLNEREVVQLGETTNGN